MGEDGGPGESWWSGRMGMTQNWRPGWRTMVTELRADIVGAGVREAQVAAGHPKSETLRDQRKSVLFCAPTRQGRREKNSKFQTPNSK